MSYCESLKQGQLLPRMERFLSDGYKAVPDSNPELTKRVKRVVQETLENKSSKEDKTVSVLQDRLRSVL